MFNKIFLVGRLGKDPELKRTKNDKTMCQVSIATQEKKDDPVQWHNCLFFEKTAEILEKYCKKGGRVFIEGKVLYTQYEKDGIKKNSTQVMVNKLTILDFKEDVKSVDNNEKNEFYPF